MPPENTQPAIPVGICNRALPHPLLPRIRLYSGVPPPLPVVTHRRHWFSVARTLSGDVFFDSVAVWIVRDDLCTPPTPFGSPRYVAFNIPIFFAHDGLSSHFMPPYTTGLGACTFNSPIQLRAAFG